MNTPRGALHHCQHVAAYYNYKARQMLDSQESRSHTGHMRYTAIIKFRNVYVSLASDGLFDYHAD